MLLKNRTLVEELLINRKKTLSEEQLLEAVYSILNQNEIERHRISTT
jgi:hypothetical protein